MGCAPRNRVEGYAIGVHEPVSEGRLAQYAHAYDRGITTLSGNRASGRRRARSRTNGEHLRDQELAGECLVVSAGSTTSPHA
jgi:hypothetical protein